ncbi:MAG: ABC transporter permease [Candidatus Ventricola sp.]|nr:ABC transporter permease [Candidatus Ventricola sp.]
MRNKALTVPFVLWAMIFIVVPLIMIVWYGVTVEETPAYTEVVLEDGATYFQLEDGTLTTERPVKRAVVSLANFKRMLEPTYLKLLLRSLKVAVITTVICLLLGYPVALILTGKDFRRPALWLMLLILPMWMNFLLRTYATMNILSTVPLLDRLFMNNINGVLLGMVYNYLPFMILPIYSSLSKMDHSLIEAASDLGASPRRTFWKIVFPLSAPGVVSGITMVFMPAVSTFAIATLIGGSKVTIIGDIIQRYFGKMSTWGIGSALSVVLMLFIIISMLITAVANARSGKQKQTRPKGVKNHA